MECKDLAIDLMHLSTDEAGEIKDSSGLKVHLKECLACQQKLSELRGAHLFSVLARPRSAKYQCKMKSLLSKVKAEATKVVPARLPKSQRDGGQVIKPLPGEKVLDNEDEIGSVAGKLWHYLAQNGKVKMNEIRHKVKLPNTKVALALGWLARENKVCLTKKRKVTFVHLAPEEVQKHQAQV